MAMQSGFIKRIRDIMRMDAGINGDAQRIEQMVWMLFLKVYDAKEDDWELNEDNYESIIPEDLRWRNWAKADSNGHAMTGDKLLNFVNNTLFPVLKGNDVKEGDTIVYEGIKVTPATPIKKAIVKSTFEDANNYMKDGVYLRQVIDIIDEIQQLISGHSMTVAVCFRPISPSEVFGNDGFVVVLVQFPVIFFGIVYFQEKHPYHLLNSLSIAVDTCVHTHNITDSFYKT